MRSLFAAALLCAAAATAHAEIASCYGPESGRRTASGERFDWNAMTAAHRALAFGTLVRVCYSARAGGPQARGGMAAGADAADDRRCVVVRINDRGPFVRRYGRYSRDIDLSDGACRRIGLYAAGVGAVTLEVLPPGTTVYLPKNREWTNF